MLRRPIYQNNFIILDGVTSATTGSTIDVEAYRHVVLALSAEDSPDATIKIHGSISQEAPDFTSASANDNHHANIQVLDLQNGSTTDGNTGLVISSASHRLLELQTNCVKWVNATVDPYTAGTFYLFGKAASS